MLNVLRTLGLVVMLSIMSADFAFAQAQVDVNVNHSGYSPDGQFGFGVNNAGLHIQYAISPAFHMGLNLNLDLNSRDSVPAGTSTTGYDFGPYFKFIFAGAVVKPYAYASLGIIKPGSGKFVISRYGGVSAVAPETELELKIAFGAEHFFNRNVGLYGHVTLANLLLSKPTSTDFGLLGAVAGAEFFF